MKRSLILLSLLSTILIAATACAATPGALRIDRYNDDGTALAKPAIVDSRANGILTTNSTSALVFAPRSEFVTTTAASLGQFVRFSSGTAVWSDPMSATQLSAGTDTVGRTITAATLSTAFAGKQNANSALSKITESNGQPLWNGSAWPGSNGLPINGNGVSIKNPTPCRLEIATDYIRADSGVFFHSEAGGNDTTAIVGDGFRVTTNSDINIETVDYASRLNIIGHGGVRIASTSDEYDHNLTISAVRAVIISASGNDRDDDDDKSSVIYLHADHVTVPAGSSPQDAVNKSQLDALEARIRALEAKVNP